MTTFMVVASFTPETDLPQIREVIAEEVAAVEALRAEGRIGSVHVSPEKGRVFLEVIEESDEAAQATVETLPMARWWAIEIFPTQGPPPPSS